MSRTRSASAGNGDDRAEAGAPRRDSARARVDRHHEQTLTSPRLVRPIGDARGRTRRGQQRRRHRLPRPEAAKQDRRLDDAPYEQRRVDEPRIRPLRLEAGANRIGDVGHLADRREQRLRSGRSERGGRARRVAREQAVLRDGEESVAATLLGERRRDEPIRAAREQLRRPARPGARCRCPRRREAFAPPRARAPSSRAARSARASPDRCCSRCRRRRAAATPANRGRATARAPAFPPTSRSTAAAFACEARASRAPNRAAPRSRSARADRSAKTPAARAACLAVRFAALADSTAATPRECRARRSRPPARIRR